MRLVILVVMVVGVVVVLGMWLVGQRRSGLDPRLQEPVDLHPDGGPPRPPVEIEGRRPDGSPVPGSQEHRNRQGKP